MNNRQAGRRNRGRNNGRPNGSNRGGDNGNRIDNRARGNAPQLLEKYKNLARDAQLAGDRVNAEYYLQFVDHYFRVIADNRLRQEEQQARYRRVEENYDDDGDGESYAETGGNDFGEGIEAVEGEFAAEQNFAPRNRRDDNRRDDNRRDDNRGRRERRPRPADGDMQAVESDQAEQPAAENADGHDSGRSRRVRQPRRAQEQASGEDLSLDIAALPPAIARADNDAEEAEAPAPRKRTRKPRQAEAEAAE